MNSRRGKVATKKFIEIILTPDEITGPFSLDATLLSGQTSEASWVRVNRGFWDVEEIKGQLLKYEVQQIGTVENPKLHVKVMGIYSSQSNTAIKNYLTKILRLNDDLEEFYSKFRNDPVAVTFNPCKGLRLMLASNPFESLICSISSQNTSVKRWNSIIQLIRSRFGKKVLLTDGSSFYIFPKPKSLVRAGEDAIRSCKAGYRTNYILTASRLVAEGKLDLVKLSKMNYEEARRSLLEVYGVGPKVADCFLLYGLGFMQAAPVDVWVHRIVQKLYKEKMTISRVSTFLHDRFGLWAGYAGLYLFHFARLHSSQYVKTLKPKQQKIEQ